MKNKRIDRSIVSMLRSMFGANGGIRTPKLSPADFKSAVYAVPPHSQLKIEMLQNHPLMQDCFRTSNIIKAGGCFVNKNQK